MKKICIFTLLLLISLTIFALNYEVFNPKYHYPNTLNVCFSKDMLGNSDGEINLEYINDIVKTPFTTLNKVFTDNKVINMKRLYRVKDRVWNREGIYPMNIFQLEVKDPSLIQVLYKNLSSLEGVIFVEFDPILKIDFIPNDNMLVSAWHIPKIDAFKAWNYETGNALTIIGVVDSGVKWNHPDLRNNMWINESEMINVTINNETGQIIGGDGIDNDNNGFVDDVFGWDFYATGDNEDNNPYQAYDGNYHGTHVAGCAAEIGDNNIGTVGPAFNARIMATKHQPSNYGTNYIYNGYSGVYYCSDSGADIINCSWGGNGGAEVANTAATYAKDHGALMICAASNDNTDNTYSHYYPSDAVDGVSVAATDINDLKASFSNYGTPIDVSAPGVSILATVYTMEGYNSYTSLQGTSMASPVASGVAALIKSMHPELTPLELRERLKIGCDNIDYLNPGYEGKLGSGRVNAYNSLMYDKLPYLSVDSYQINEIIGDMDGNLNPGETVNIHLSLKNRENWLTANDLSVKLRSNSDLITIADSLINITQINSGAVFSSDDVFTVTISPDFPVIQNAEFTLVLNSNNQNPYVYNETIVLNIPVTCMKADWPFIGENALNTPLVDDINNDGINELIFNDSNGTVYVMDKDKNPLPGFPVHLNEYVFAAPSILEKENSKEIVICTVSKMYRISNTGLILSAFNPNSVIRVSPLIVDQNNDGDLDIVFGTMNKKLYIIEADGITQNSYSPVTLDASIVTPLAVGKDGTIYVSTNNFRVQSIGPDGALNAIQPFPYNLESISLNGPVVVCSANPSDNTENIIVAGNKSSNNKLAIIHKNSTEVAELILNSGVNSGPIVVPQGDDYFIAFGTYDRKFHIMNQTFSYVANSPINNPDTIEPSPLSVDIDADNQQEIMFTTGNGNITFIKTSGDQLINKNIQLNNTIKYTPIIGSFDSEDQTDILIPSGSLMNYLDLKTDFASSNWPVYRQNNQRTAKIFGNPITDLDDDNLAEIKLCLTNYPNPFNPITNIMFNLNENCVIDLNIYNVKGQIVRNLFNGHVNKGHQSFTWNGHDNNDKPVSSGIYFYRLNENSKTHINKMILIK